MGKRRKGGTGEGRERKRKREIDKRETGGGRRELRGKGRNAGTPL